MMTVLTRTRVPRDKFFETSPRWLEDPTYTTQGSAKPGRGGRRKRRRRAAGERALALSLQIWEATDPHVKTWPLLLRSERLLPDPPLFGDPGRRERRRRAKLRRRRARARREGRRFETVNVVRVSPILDGRISLGKARVRLSKSPTHGA